MYVRRRNANAPVVNRENRPAAIVALLLADAHVNVAAVEAVLRRVAQEGGDHTLQTHTVPLSMEMPRAIEVDTVTLGRLLLFGDDVARELDQVGARQPELQGLPGL